MLALFERRVRLVHALPSHGPSDKPQVAAAQGRLKRHGVDNDPSDHANLVAANSRIQLRHQMRLVLQSREEFDDRSLEASPGSRLAPSSSNIEPHESVTAIGGTVDGPVRQGEW
jgi:hypothetical protein